MGWGGVGMVLKKLTAIPHRRRKVLNIGGRGEARFKILGGQGGGGANSSLAVK